MSGKRQSQEPTPTIPLSIVFTAVGFIIILTVTAIWIIVPAKMPQPLYDILGPYLQTSNPQLPPLEPIAAVPAELTNSENTADLLPETPLEEALPDYFVSALEATAVDPEKGQPTRIVIPSINLDAPVTTVSLKPLQQGGQTYYQWQVPPARKAGWHNSSARLGEPGNTVLNGHHNIHGEVFRDLIDLNEGDEITMYDTYRAFTYRIITKQVLEERGQSIATRLENARWIQSTDNERLTLITCWPYTDNSHRVIIVAEPVNDTESSHLQATASR